MRAGMPYKDDHYGVDALCFQQTDTCCSLSLITVIKALVQSVDKVKARKNDWRCLKTKAEEPVCK